VLIPNSYFLNNKIINWTLTDQKIRLRINVGVAYGSDVREVEKLLLKAADDHSRVLGKPEPYVVFREFGPNAMEFSLFFWVDMTNASTVKVASDLRFRLVALFEDKNITVAFPQMDVHLNATEPIEVFMRRPAREALPPQQEEN
jgi:small-conductance mechanosensitive channel